MENFIYSIPTKIAFGKGQVERLPAMVREFGQKVLLVYGGGSIKRTGIYGTVTELLKENGIEYEELSGVEPNPRLSTVKRGVALCQQTQVDVILPIGGGSTIDCAKAIAAGTCYDGDPWDLVLDNDKIKEALPIIAILTLSATGSEMDTFAVITNDETQDKMDLDSPVLFPKYSVLDPTYTFSVPAYQTASGTADIMSHVFEVYLNGNKPLQVQKGMMESILKTCIQYGPYCCQNPEDYEGRANLMWASSWAINGFITSGVGAPWPCHAMEHQLSAYYDVTHGHGLAILTPVWMEYILNEKTVDMFADYGVRVFGLDPSLPPMETAKKAIAATKKVFDDMGLSDTLRSIGITEKDKFREMAEKAVAGGLAFCQVPLTVEDVIAIYEKCF